MSLLLIKQIVLGLSIAAPIGPINIEIIRRGLFQGFWPSLLVGAGGMTADCIIMFLMYQGLSYVLALEEVQLTLIVIGALVLTYTGLQSFIHQKEPAIVMERDHPMKKGLMHSYLTGVFIAAFNPLNILFWLGIYGSVLSNSFNDENKIKAFFISSAIFIGIGLWNLNLALTVHFGKKSLSQNSLNWISATASLIILGFGLHLSYQAIMRIKDFL